MRIADVRINGFEVYSRSVVFERVQRPSLIIRSTGAAKKDEELV
jgi:hypothetical protein